MENSENTMQTPPAENIQQQPVVQPAAPAVRHKKKVKKWFWLFILLVAFLTCPDAQAHKDKIKSEAAHRMTNYEGDNILLNMGLGGFALDLFLSNNFSYNSFGILSVGEMTFEGETNPVTVGLFGIVIWLN